MIKIRVSSWWISTFVLFILKHEENLAAFNDLTLFKLSSWINVILKFEISNIDRSPMTTRGVRRVREREGWFTPRRRTSGWCPWISGRSLPLSPRLDPHALWTFTTDFKRSSTLTSSLRRFTGTFLFYLFVISAIINHFKYIEIHEHTSEQSINKVLTNL